MVKGDEVPCRGATLKRVLDLLWWAPVFDSGTRTGGQRAEERRGRGVQSGCTATGGRRFGGFGAKPSPTPGKRKASTTTSEGAEMDGLVGRQCPQAYRFDGLGLKTIAHLLWAGRSLDKIETLKVSDGHVVDIARMRRS